MAGGCCSTGALFSLLLTSAATADTAASAEAAIPLTCPSAALLLGPDDLGGALPDLVRCLPLLETDRRDRSPSISEDEELIPATVGACFEPSAAGAGEGRLWNTTMYGDCVLGSKLHSFLRAFSAATWRSMRFTS